MNQPLNQLQNAIRQSFLQLENCLMTLTDVEYTTHCKLLFGATIGQHVRHIIELFSELEKGYASGVVNYENRQRDYTIETHKAFAISMIDNILKQIEKPAKNLLLHACYDDNSENRIEMPTNYYRELAYNLEHTVHHMALIRVGVSEVGEIAIESNFGIASATIKYRQSCAQ